MPLSLDFKACGLSFRLESDRGALDAVEPLVRPFLAASNPQRILRLVYDPTLHMHEVHGSCARYGVHLAIHGWRQMDMTIKFKELQLRTLSAAVGFLISSALVEEQGLLLHASGVQRSGVATVFVGPSGAGKSTVASNITGHKVFHEERIALRKLGAEWWAYSVPQIDNREVLRGPGGGRLGRIFLLRKGHTVSSRLRSSQGHLQGLFSQVVVPFADPETISKVTALGLDLFHSRRVHELTFGRNSDVRHVIEDLS